jgi:NOL1/NOP2/fmu family ribosome biogenesis protein
MPDDFMMKKNDESNTFITKEAAPKANEIVNLFSKATLTAEAGIFKGKDFIPSHFLAMSGVQHADYLPVEVDLERALDYLERNTQSLPQGLKPGWYRIVVEGSVLGWAKNTMQGWKNHFPLPWRLRSRKMS